MIKYLLVLLLILAPISYASAPINFASGIDPKSFDKLHPKLRDIAYYIAGFCAQNNIKFVITSTIRSKERNAQVKSVSLTHVEGRAFDMSIKEQWGWNDYLILILVEKVEKIYGSYGAYSNVNGKQVLVFNHDAGNGVHLHYQVFKGLPWK